MSMQNKTILEEIKYRYETGGVLTRLIMINVGVFLAINILRVVLMLMSKNGDVISEGSTFQIILHYLMIPSEPMMLIKRFWTLITHMFTHEGLLHILFNMLWLYWFGEIFKQYIGESKLTYTYILGGLTGAMLFVIAYNVFPAFKETSGFALGASGAVTAIVVATAVMVPNYSMRFLIIGSVKLKWIAAFVVVFDFISIPNGNAGGQIAHLGGALYGYLFMINYKNGIDWTKPLNIIGDRIKSVFTFNNRPMQGRKKSKVRMAYKNKEKMTSSTFNSNAKTTTPENNSTARSKQERIDEILDKIGQSGYPSLTEEEKAFLFKYSNE